jgi:hypothetical protein
MTALVGHVAVAPRLAVRGTAPDLLLVGVVAVAAERGSRAGAAFGFAAGLGADLFLATPLGTSALAFTLVGHVLGRSRRSRPSGTAAALCSPTSTCFACRTGRRHDAAPSGEPAARPSRARQRVAARRTALRRAAVLTALGVGGGQLATTAVATSLGGLPFPAVGSLVRMAGIAALSAPLGPPVFAAVRRLRPTAPGGRR